MVAYSFKSQFAEPILERRKCQTIRDVGKRRHAYPGDTIQIYTGMRSRHCKLVTTAICLENVEVTIDFDEEVVVVGRLRFSRRARIKSLDMFARLDGFAGWPAFVDFWSINHFKRKPPRGRWTGRLIRFELAAAPF